MLNQKTELQRALQKQKERISQHNREDNSSANHGHGIGQELAQEIARRNVRNFEGNSSKSNDNNDTLNEEYLRIKSSLKHNRINNSEIWEAGKNVILLEEVSPPLWGDPIQSFIFNENDYKSWYKKKYLR